MSFQSANPLPHGSKVIFLQFQNAMLVANAFALVALHTAGQPLAVEVDLDMWFAALLASAHGQTTRRRWPHAEGAGGVLTAVGQTSSDLVPHIT
ncbi:MAG: hypothetical protein WBE89_17915 [Methyloceanibacter sp.]